MATFKICVFRHQRRDIDGKYPVSIRVYWQKKSAYIGTEYYVESEQITQNKRKNIFELRDTSIIRELTFRIKTYETAKVDKLGLDIYKYSATELARYFEDLTSNKASDKEIDFIQFGRDYIEKETAKGRNLKRINSTINALSDFSGSALNINDISARYLSRFEEYLKSERNVIRLNQLGKEVTVIHAGVSETTISGYMKDIRTVFNAAIAEFNDEDRGIMPIKRYPFKKYKVPTQPKSGKRSIPAQQLFKISRLPESHIQLQRSIVARDAFMLSFALVGMNFKDMYELKKRDFSNSRITYKRAKTRDRRLDDALISIKVEPEAVKYIDKFRDNTDSKFFFIFHRLYSTSEIFVTNISIGLKRVGEAAGIKAPLSTYYARHSWATIARNKCKISKSDIDECLNHVNKNEEMADVYIEKDWSIIDESNRKVLDYVFIASNPRKVFVKRIASKPTKFVRKCGKRKTASLLKPFRSV